MDIERETFEAFGHCLGISDAETEELPAECRVCGGSVATCGPLVSDDGEETWIGLKHLPNVGERRSFRG